MIVVFLDGGFVRAVYTDDPKRVGEDVEVWDYDTEGMTEGDLDYIELPLEDGKPVEVVSAYVDETELELLECRKLGPVEVPDGN